MTPRELQRSEARRIGLMGATSTPENVQKVLAALKVCLRR